MKICKVENCSNGHYAKGYCKKHHEKIRRTGTLKKLYRIVNKGKTCKVPNCNNPADTKGLCGKHYYRWLKYGDVNKAKYEGTSEYPNHILMKKNRLIILLHNPRCEMCGKKAITIHHKDFTKTNHQLSNLQALCQNCHIGIHLKKMGYTNYFELYGISVSGMIKKFGHSYIKYRRMHKKGKLKDFLAPLVF